jgi:hypothetical protein
MSADSRVVMFADILRFGSLTESNPLDVDLLKLLSGPIGRKVFEQIEATKDPLAATFAHFHQAVKFVNEMAAIEHRVTSITFSDSAFFATVYLSEAAEIARRLLLHLLWQKVPVRIGIAFGTPRGAWLRIKGHAGWTDQRHPFLRDCRCSSPCDRKLWFERHANLSTPFGRKPLDGSPPQSGRLGSRSGLS